MRNIILACIGLFLVLFGGAVSSTANDTLQTINYLGFAAVALGGALLSHPVTAFVLEQKEESRWLPIAQSSTRQLETVILSLESYRDTCLPDCSKEAQPEIIEFCKHTKHSLSSATEQLQDVKDNWISFIRENCVDCNSALRAIGIDEDQ